MISSCSASAQVAEVIAVTGNTHNQVAVLLGIVLCMTQGGRIHHVKLDVMPVQPEVSAHQLDQVIQAFIASQQVPG